MRAICQRCRRDVNEFWTIREATFNVGPVDHWKVQLCVHCTSQVSLIVLGALAEVREDHAESEAAR